MANVLDNFKRSKNITTVFYILGVLYIVSLVSNFFQYRLLDNMNIFNVNLVRDAETNDQRQIIIAVLILITNIVAIILFIQWLRRAYHNLHKAKMTGLNFSEGWAAGAWFVPFLNLVRPYQIMAEVWKRTKDYIRSSGHKENASNTDNHLKPSTSVQIVGWWWALYLAANVVDSVSNSMAKNGSSVSDILDATSAAMIGNVLKIVAIVITIKLIKESQIQQDKFYQSWLNRDDPKSSTFNLSENDDILD